MPEQKNIRPGDGNARENSLFHTKQYKKHRRISYAKYGYLFLIPFFLVFILFQLIPLLQTFYYSLFRYFQNGLDVVGPTFKGLDNFKKLFTDGQMWKYMGNTMLIWIIGFIPQMIVSLLLAIWFTDSRLKIHGTKFFQTVTYMPNLVMAAAFGYMFNMLFAQGGPVNQILAQCGWISEPVQFTSSIWWVRVMIGGIQLFDAAQVFTLSKGGPDKTSMTIMMYLYTLITSSKNYGLAGALSVVLFVITGVLSLIVFKTMVPSNNPTRSERRAKAARLRYVEEGHKEAEKARQKALKEGGR